MAETKRVSKGGEEYELVPKKQLDYLLAEVEKLKRNPLGEGQHAHDLYNMMAQVNVNLQKFVSILQGASDEIVRDYRDETQSHKMNILMKQNEKLGEGVLLIADLLKELKAHFKKADEKPAPNPFKEQQSGQQPSQATPDMPPPPPADWGPPPGQQSGQQDAWAVPPPEQQASGQQPPQGQPGQQAPGQPPQGQASGQQAPSQQSDNEDPFASFGEKPDWGTVPK